MDANVDSLVSFQAGFVIRSTGLGTLYELVEREGLDNGGGSNGEPASTPTVVLSDFVPETALKKIMGQFDVFLAHPDTLLMPQLGLLASLKLRDLIRRRSNDLVHSAYARLFNAIRRPTSGYAEPASLVPRTPEQVADLILNC